MLKPHPLSANGAAKAKLRRRLLKKARAQKKLAPAAAPAAGKPLVEVLSATPEEEEEDNSERSKLLGVGRILKGTFEEKSQAYSSPAAPKSIIVRAQSIEYLEAAALKPVATNPRRHDRANVAKIVRSIQTYGWTTPLLITDHGEVIAGHGRLLAAEQLGQSQIPCIRLSHLTPELVEAYRIADNRLALDSEWDDQLLTEAIRRLGADPGFDLKLTGFDQSEIEDFLFTPGSGLIDEDELPLPHEAVVAARGDIWALGSHRLACDDSTSPLAVARLLEGETPVIMVTDPPYGVSYDATWRHEAGINRGVSIRENAAVNNDDRSDWREAWALFHGPIAYVWHSGIHGPRVAESLLVTGLEIRSQIIWVKNNIAIGRGHYHWRHEPCWYAVRKGATARWEGDRKQSTIWEIDNLDVPSAAGLEINPAYVDIALRRWQAYTGNVARLGLSGPSFEEVASVRKQAL